MQNPLEHESSAEAGSCRPKRPLRRIAALLVLPLAAVIALFVVFARQAPLSTEESRMLGIWTWQDSPGELVLYYRDDRTGVCTGKSYRDRTYTFLRWWVADGHFHIETSPQNAFQYFAAKYVLRQRCGEDAYPLRFPDDGTVAITLPDGTERTMIPWQGERADWLRRVER